MGCRPHWPYHTTCTSELHVQFITEPQNGLWARPQKSFIYQSCEKVVCIIETVLQFFVSTPNRCSSHRVEVLLEIGSCRGSHGSQKGSIRGMCVCVCVCLPKDTCMLECGDGVWDCALTLFHTLIVVLPIHSNGCSFLTRNITGVYKFN